MAKKDKKKSKKQKAGSKSKKKEQPDNTNNEILSPEEALKKDFYWKELWQQAEYLELNHRVHRPNFFTYYIAFPMEVYNISMVEEEDPKQRKKAAKGKKK